MMAAILSDGIMLMLISWYGAGLIVSEPMLAELLKTQIYNNDLADFASKGKLFVFISVQFFILAVYILTLFNIIHSRYKREQAQFPEM